MMMPDSTQPVLEYSMPCQGSLPTPCSKANLTISSPVHILSEIVGIDQKVFEWSIRALRESCSDEKCEHREAIARLQAEWGRLQTRIDAMSVDKLDGRIEEASDERMRAQWPDEQERCERDIERHRATDDWYMDRASRSSIWARTLHLFMAQSAKEKRYLPAFELDLGGGHARRRVQGTF
jgi:hypothetical protein